MTPAQDPYRTLGVAPGAPIEEIRRAYRRLAKANHPDTAGPSAVPRFLAIQQAYEALVGSRPNGPAGAAAADGPPPRWRADPARARTTRESWQSRAGRRPPDAEQPPPGESAGPRRRRAGPRTRPGGGGPRPPDRATPGSTSYDFAEHEPFDPEWSGASWYGQSSGTYWTINPKEYADPRKHGPEYQARARRRADAETTAGAEAQPAAEAGSSDEAQPTAEARSAGETRPAGESDAQPGSRPAGANGEPEGVAAPEPDPAGTDAQATAERTRSRARGAGAATDAPPRPRFVPPAGAMPGDSRRGPAWDEGAASAVSGAPSIEDELLDVVRSAGARRSRVALALLAWPPIGLGLAFVLGELSGCGRFAATCVDGFAMSTWIGQLTVILVLLIVPGLAAIAAVGTLATLAAAIPIAVLLSAAGGSRDPGSAGAVLAASLAAAWLVGVAVAVVRRSRTVRA